MNEESIVEIEEAAELREFNDADAVPEAAFDPDEDLAVLKEEFAELSLVKSLSDIEGATRYGALRDLGLTPSEAYRATRTTPTRQNTRAHLSSAVPRMAVAPGERISREELRMMRGIFSDLSDSDLQRLYKKVTN